MKILQINCFYRHGSTGRIVQALHAGALARGHESSVCYGRRPVPPEDGVVRVSSEWERYGDALATRLVGMNLAHSPTATRRLLRLLAQWAPDAVHLHCLNGHFVDVYRLMDYLKYNRIPTVLTLHAELMHTAGCDYAEDCEKWRVGCRDCSRLPGAISRLWQDNAAEAFWRMREAMEGFDTLTVAGVSPWVCERAAGSPIMAGRRMVTVRNGVDTLTFRPRPAEAAEWRRGLGIADGERVILHVTPHFAAPVKGGGHVLELAARMPDCRFLVVGWDGDRRALPAPCRSVASLGERLIPIPHTEAPDALAALYTLADLTLLPSRRETFSMVLAESLACGTPVVGFEAGGPESIAPEGCAVFVPQGDTDALWAATRAVLSAPADRSTLVALAVAAFSAERMVEEYLALYAETVEAARTHAVV